MIELHTHTLFSDGELLPSELVYRAKTKGYSAICLADHIDISTMDFTIPRIARVAKQLTHYYGIVVLPGAEISFNPPEILKDAVRSARKMGAKIVLIHGETTAEPVPPGTNRAGILAGADIIAHPGKITPGDVKLASDKNICLEITARSFHSKMNGHVYSLAKRFGAKLVFSSDIHSPESLTDHRGVRKILRDAGIPYSEFLTMQRNAAKIINRIK